MRFAILLGILLIATPLLLRAQTPDPWPDAQSYAVVHELNATPMRSVLAGIPVQLVLIIAAALFLFLVSNIDKPESFVILLATSPAFITEFTLVGPGVLGGVLIALGGVLLARKKHWAILFIPLCFLLGINIGILASMVFVVIAIMQGLPFIALGVSFFALVSSTTLALATSTQGVTFISPGEVWSDILIGGQGGVTLFVLALGIMGFLIQYKKSKDALTFLPIALIVLAPFFEYGNLVIAVVFAYAGSDAWEYLCTREWRFEELQSITLILIVCSVLFTTIVTVKELSDADDDRINLQRFVIRGLPSESFIAAESDIAGLLQSRGFATGEPNLPSDPSFIANALREQGYTHIITRDTKPPYQHLPVAYATGSATTYTIYAVPPQ